MAYLDRIHECNGWDPAAFLPFLVEGAPRGWVRHGFAEQLARWAEVFLLEQGALRLHPGLTGFERRRPRPRGRCRKP